MTHEEAIIMLHGLRIDYTCSACEEHNNPKLKNFPRDCPLYSNCNNVHDALADAIEALEKQIPKKAKVQYDWYVLTRWKCNDCGGEIDSPMGYSVSKYPFCPYCGQAIDWSDTNEID